MKKTSVLFFALFLLLTAEGWGANEFVLIMSKEDDLCQHMLKLYNDDLRKYGEVKYDKHEEFNWIKWEEKEIKLIPPSMPQAVTELSGRIALFDINNDSKDEVIIYTEGMLSSNITNDYDIFRYDDLAMLNEIVDGSKYYAKVLKSFSSNDGVPVYLSDLSEEDIKKLPERMKDSIVEAKKMKIWEKNTYSLGDVGEISFLKVKKRFYVYVVDATEDTGYYDYSEGRYSIISELQKDNTLKDQCLYLFKKGKPSKRRTK